MHRFYNFHARSHDAGHFPLAAREGKKKRKGVAKSIKKKGVEANWKSFHDCHARLSWLVGVHEPSGASIHLPGPVATQHPALNDSLHLLTLAGGNPLSFHPRRDPSTASS